MCRAAKGVVRRVAAVVALSLLAVPARSAGATEVDVDAFIERITSDDDGERMAARNAAPELGAAVVVALGRAMDGEHREGAINAKHALDRIVHHAGDPDAPRDVRRAVLASLVELTEADVSAFVLRETLWSLGLIGGDEEAPVVASFLGHDGRQVAETARLVLERMPGDGAVDALIAAARAAEDGRKPDFIFSLGTKGSDRANDPLLAWTRSTNEGVRFAAWQALAHSGARAAVQPFTEALGDGDDPLRTKLFTEYQRLADELRERGETDTFESMHELALASAPLDFQRERSLLRLCRAGDSASVPRLLVGLRDSSARVRDAALRTLRATPGAATFEALASGFEEAESVARPVILRAMAEIDAEKAKPHVASALSSDDPELQIAALALRGEVAPELEESYLSVARDDESVVRATALDGYLSLASADLEVGRREDALEKFSNALEVSRSPEEKLRALEGLVAVGDPAAIDDLLPLLADPQLARKAAEGTIAFAQKIGEAGEVDRAEKYLDGIVAGRFPLDVVVSAASVLRELGRDPRAGTLAKGFVLDWWVIGPMRDRGDAMSTSFFPEERIDLDAVERIGPRRYRWKEIERLSLEGRIDLVVEFRRSESVVGYAYTELELSEARDALFKIGSDDGIVCWLNGEEVLRKPEPRGYVLDQDAVPVRLREGRNEVLLKIGQGNGSWEFSFRVTDRAGEPIDASEL